MSGSPASSSDLLTSRFVLAAGAEHVERDKKQNDAFGNAEGCLGDIEIGQHQRRHNAKNSMIMVATAVPSSAVRSLRARF